MDFAILGTTKSPEFCDLGERVGLQRDRRLVRYAESVLLSVACLLKMQDNHLAVH